MAAVGTHDTDGGSGLLTGDESLAADFALVLPIAAVVVIEVQMGSPAERADGILRDVFPIAALDRFHSLAVFPLVVFQEELPVLSDERFDDGHPVNGRFLVFWGMGIVKGPLFERDVSANKLDQPAVLLIKVLNCMK